MNRYEAVILDKMVDIERERLDMRENGTYKDNLVAYGDLASNILLLLDCICDFREPPKTEPLEGGCGKLVNDGKE